MLENLRKLPKYRGLIQSLVARELKARYRGSVLGFFWSFFNPLLLLLVYTFVFTVVLPGGWDEKLGPRALFLFCGLLPWTWFSSSLIESSNVLISGGNLIKKVMFPAEILPIVSVLVEPRALPVRVDHPGRVPDLLQSAAAVVGARLVSGGRIRPAAAVARPRADSLGDDRALPRHQGHSVEPADAVVFRDADYLSDGAGDRHRVDDPGLGEAV